jgi:Ca2+/H+ antiporter, TMEM165/GDT1 family
MGSGTTWALLLAVFFAAVVEFVEALTIVLAMGITRGWRSALAGTAAAVVALAAFTAAAGYAITRWLPESALQLTIGTLLLIFGLQWLRKGILRAAGLKALHDEEAAFARETAAALAAGGATAAARDWYGFTVAFKGVLLEGLEVAFIVVTFGASQRSLGLAVGAAVLAVVVVVGLGFAVRRPLARVPENALKLAVGLLLTSFGTFWAGEGAGLSWPGGDAAIVVLVAVYASVVLALTAWLRGGLAISSGTGGSVA